MHRILLITFFLCSLQTQGKNSEIHVESALVQQKIQPAINQIRMNKFKNYAIKEYSKFSKNSTDKSAQRIEENRGIYCETSTNRVYDNFQQRVLRICDVESTWGACDSEEKNIIKMTQNLTTEIHPTAQGVLDQLISTRDIYNSILTEVQNANDACSNHLNSTVLSEGCLSSFEIALNEKELSVVREHCTIEQVEELKAGVEAHLQVLSDGLTRIQDKHIINRQREVTIYNSMMKIEESISQIESTKRSPSNTPHQKPADGN